MAAAGTLAERRSEKAVVAPRRVRRPLVLLAVSSVVTAILALPLVFLLIEAHGAGASELAHLIFRPLTASLLWNTIRLTVVVTAACAVIGTAAAWCVERTAGRGRCWW
jgi:iron(III) transport system permease protein